MLTETEVEEIAVEILNNTMIGRTPEDTRKIIVYIYENTKHMENPRVFRVVK